MDSTSWLGQISVGVVSGVVVLLIQLVIERVKRPANALNRTTAITTTVTVTQVQVNASEAMSGRTQQSRSTSSSSSDTSGLIVGAAIAAIMSAVLFLHLHPYLLAITVGASLALVLGTVYALRMTVRNFQRIPRQAVFALINTLIALATAAVAWIGVYNTRKGALSLAEIDAATKQAIPDGAGPEWLRSLGTVGAQVGELLEIFGPVGGHFLVFLLFGAASAAVLVFLAATTVFDWLAFLRFTRVSVPSPFLAKRALLFSNTSWGSLVAVVMMTAISIAMSQGWAFDLVEMSTGRSPQ
ncbi:hypothetical protein O1W71_11960 [Microbacterium sp. H37-C3]|uniref:hypothetical protein n=1 Tax=Microbacterium sp. H37-C3 TaxID=3004354 RepID=UPI0022AEA8F7|nr:hypothetical protein [Microbacterium sp. H37-C3]MCZ4068385.1 hypothetical protein [Microbacterium sp. H37-C3]